MVKSLVTGREAIEYGGDDLLYEELRFWREFNQFTRSKLGRPYIEGKLYEELKSGILEFLGSPEGCWFDAGCGNLPVSKWILEKANRNIRIWAGDIDVSGAAEEIKQIKDGHLITVMYTDLTKEWPFPSDFFDGVVANHVFTFLTRPEKAETNGALKEALEEAYRVLKPGGILIWTMPKKNADTLYGLFHSLKYLLNPSRWQKYGPSLLLTTMKAARYTRKIDRKAKSGIYALLDKEECEQMLYSIGFIDLEWKNVFARQSWLNKARKPAG